MSGARDFSSETGAHELKARIDEYWSARGYKVRSAVVHGPFHMSMRAARFEVRSDMVNGLPREALP